MIMLADCSNFFLIFYCEFFICCNIRNNSIVTHHRIEYIHINYSLHHSKYWTFGAVRARLYDFNPQRVRKN